MVSRVYVVIFSGDDELDLRIKRLQGCFERGSLFELHHNVQIAKSDGYLAGSTQELDDKTAACAPLTMVSTETTARRSVLGASVATQMTGIFAINSFRFQ